ncbi:hypothetical protein HNY73_008936 [Argiope bruennichi]|uniref:Protein kinase domain-containing protein n=1 Tax=Argiope bruennichi TaxID=94029 RepID=A0A8T0F8X0_ARGBR|nr:hypothetical protein HNY73_008936 [Argiope bruennichi]
MLSIIIFSKSILKKKQAKEEKEKMCGVLNCTIIIKDKQIFYLETLSRYISTSTFKFSEEDQCSSFISDFCWKPFKKISISTPDNKVTYNAVKYISRGSFGVVLKVETAGATYAAKVLLDPDTKEAVILREKAILDKLGGSPNRQLFIHMHDWFLSGDSYIQIYEYMAMDLRKYLWEPKTFFSIKMRRKILLSASPGFYANCSIIFGMDSQVDEDQVGPLSRIAFSVPEYEFTHKEMLERIKLSELVKGCLALHPSSRMQPDTALDADFFKTDERREDMQLEDQELLLPGLGHLPDTGAEAL